MPDLPLAGRAALRHATQQSEFGGDMRVLLSEGSGLTSRQVATRLGELGHEVEVLSSSTFCLARSTRYVRRVHRVPAFGETPLVWLERAVAIAQARAVDLLFPTQEQVTVLSAFRERLPVATVVPPFAALRRVQDKHAAYRTLEQLGLSQPRSQLLRDPSALAPDTRFPVFVKRAVSTASTGVRRAADSGELRRVFSELSAGEPELLVQEAAQGSLVMIQALADGGKLVAVHANWRVREGAGGGASAKQSWSDPRIEADVARLVAVLSWHGPISLDAIVTSAGPVYIDVNPRLVEPRNALLAGVDLVALMLRIARGEHPPRQPLGKPGVRSHQLLLAELAAAQSGGRSAVLRELLQALAHAGPYADSVEELTSAAGDLRALLLPAGVALAAVIAPATWRLFARSSIEAYAITPAGWAAIQCEVDRQTSTGSATRTLPKRAVTRKMRLRLSHQKSHTTTRRCPL